MSGKKMMERQITKYQWTDNNPTPDLDNINAYSKFG